jgi:galactokinase
VLAAPHLGPHLFPSQVSTTVRASLSSGSDDLVATTMYGEAASASVPLSVLREGVPALSAVREFLRRRDSPAWMAYVFGCLAVFARETGWLPPVGSGLVLDVQSTVPAAQGVSSSASVEVAVLRALVALSGRDVPPRRLAVLAQEAENHVVGAPCGIMDQLAVSFGSPGQVLPILCRPDEPLQSLPLPLSARVIGWPSGVKHSVAGSPYSTARAAAFMGKKILEGLLDGRRVAYLTELPPSIVRRVLSEVPATLTGAEFISRWGSCDDALSVIRPEAVYPVQAAVSFPVEENFRCSVVRSLLQALQHFPPASEPAEDALGLIGEQMALAHLGYSSIGLGAPVTDRIVAEAMRLGAAGGVYGARVSGGGSGGTVVVLCRDTAIPALQVLADKIAAEHGVSFPGFIF